MRLFELAYAVRIYAQMTDYDSSLNRFRQAADGGVDLRDPGQARACLVWLNAWGCRQFSVEHHDEAAAMLANWWDEWAAKLPPQDVDLDAVDDGALLIASSAYGDLTQRQAGRRQLRDGRPSLVTVGPTGAAKVLYAVRPRVFPPWDDPIRKALGLDGGSRGYLRYLQDVRDQALALKAEAAAHGLDPAELGRVLGRPVSTLPRLIDEYNWVTITRGLRPPSTDELHAWHRWAAPSP